MTGEWDYVRRLTSWATITVGTSARWQVEQGALGGGEGDGGAGGRKGGG